MNGIHNMPDIDLSRYAPEHAAVIIAAAKRARERKLEMLEYGDEIWRRYPTDPLRFITDVLGQLRGDTWWGWRVIIKAIYGYPIDDPAELAFFHRIAQRDPPSHAVNQVWLIIGRRGGKDSVASMLLVERARFGNTIALRPGERALVACLATDRDQAGIVFNYTKGYYEEYPEFKSWLDDEIPKSYRSGGIKLRNKTDIRVTTNNFRAPRGYPIPAAVFDEVAFWRDENSATPDIETYRALRPGMRRYESPLLIGISTPYRKKGLLYQRYQEHFGKNDPNILVIQAETRLLNPTIDAEEIQEDRDNDPDAAKAEWDALFREDLEDYVPPEVVRACTVPGRFEIPPVHNRHYYAFVDPSGGSHDSFTLAIAHREDRTAVLDVAHEIHAPFDPTTAVKEHAETCKRYKVSKVTGDNYAGEWPKEQFQRNGIIYEVSEVNKSGIYKEALPIFRSRTCELLDSRRLFNQLTQLERRTVRGGRDSIDHPPGALDDLANAVCGALVGVTLGWSFLDVWKRLAGR